MSRGLREGLIGASDSARSITGQTFPIDGGSTSAQ